MPMVHAALMVALLSASPAIAQKTASSVPTDGVLRHFAIGGAGGWDYLAVDSAQHRLYVSRGDRVIVLDTGNGKPVGEVLNTPGVHGIALAPALHVGFTSNGKANSVTVFNLKTMKSLGDVKLDASNPDAILYDSSTHRVITFNGRSHNATVIDAIKRTVVGNIALDGTPEFGVSDGNGRVFVNIEDKDELTAIDPKTAKVVATWSLGDCEEPSGLALDAVHHRLFSVCQNRRMVVTDSNSGKRVAAVPIGAGPDAAAFDAAHRLAFSSNGEDGTITVVHADDADHYRVVATIPTQKSARTMALDDATHRIYLAAATFGPLPPDAPAHTRLPMDKDSFTVLEVGDGGVVAHEQKHNLGQH
jgi:DNA-binding beta-propeller fold protein YncE